jgi:hypothetical protein
MHQYCFFAHKDGRNQIWDPRIDFPEVSGLIVETGWLLVVTLAEIMATHIEPVFCAEIRLLKLTGNSLHVAYTRMTSLQRCSFRLSEY